MPTANGDTLTYGLDEAVPTTAPAAWGARLIVDQNGYVDLVHDRQQCAGENRGLILDLLDGRYPFDRMRDDLAQLLSSGEMSTRDAHDFTLFSDDQLEVHANTKASAGYCYVAAWAKPKRTLRRPPRDTPELYAQDGKMWDATVHAHYFIGSCDWFITEYNPAEDLAFGWACLGDRQNAEWGYTNLADLEIIRVNGVFRVDYESDWTPITMRDAIAKMDVRQGREPEPVDG